jgi:hypothetical protein
VSSNLIAPVPYGKAEGSDGIIAALKLAEANPAEFSHVALLSLIFVARLEIERLCRERADKQVSAAREQHERRVLCAFQGVES